MTIHTRPIPTAVQGKAATPFKVFVPKPLTPETAKPVWEELEKIEGIILADPYALPGVSSVFPGVVFAATAYDLAPIAAALAIAEEANPDDLADSWVELWVPESLEDVAEALDIQDLTQPPTA